VCSSDLLNEKYRYLTVAVYDQIRALMEQGRATEATNVAQRAYADAMGPRLKDVENSLGSLERAWNATKKAAAETWDAFLGIGRQQSLEDQLQQVEAALASPVRRGGNALQVAEGRKAMERRRDELRQQIYEQREAAAAQQAQAEATEKRIQTADKADQEASARADAAIARVKAEQDALVAAYADAQKVLDAQRSAGLVTEQEYYAARRALLALDRDAQVRGLAEINRIEAGRKALGDAAIQRDARIAQNREASARVQTKAGADLVIINAQEAASLQALARAQAEYWLQMQRANDARAQAANRSLAGMDRGDRAREAMGREAAIADEYNQRLQRLQDERNSGRITGPDYEQRLAALRAYYDQALDAEARYQDARQQMEADGNTGYRRALENYLDSARNVSQQTERMWSNAFSGMEDALVSFVMTGKADFRSLANSIIADLIRIYIRQQLISFLATSFGGGGGAAGAAAVNGSEGTA
jgi:lambda family phage tail tape measure protein